MRLRLAPKLFALALLICLAAPSVAREAPAHVAAPDSADTASLDELVAALYEIVSGPAGERRDWDRFRALFAPSARLLPLQLGTDGLRVPFPLTPAEFVERAGMYFSERGFFERELGRSVESFGSVIHVFSAYEVRNDPEDEEPFARGVNSIQVLFDGARYRILSMTWEEESEKNPIPDALLN